MFCDGSHLVEEKRGKEKQSNLENFSTLKIRCHVLKDHYLKLMYLCSTYGMFFELSSRSVCSKPLGEIQIFVVNYFG